MANFFIRRPIVAIVISILIVLMGGFTLTGRPDRIYEWSTTTRALKPRAEVRPDGWAEQMIADVGRGPEYEDSVALLSRHYVALGSEGPRELPELPRVQQLTESLRRAERFPNLGREPQDCLVFARVRA